MESPFDNLSPHSRPVSAASAAVGRMAQPPDGPAHASAPRTVIRGEGSSSDSLLACPDGNPRAAFTDWLNVTYPVGAGSPTSFFETFSKVTQARFGMMAERPGRGLHGWNRSYAFDHGKTLYAIGGQRNTALVSISNDGCALIPDWEALIRFFRDELDGRITRWDGATDDYEGLHSVDWAVEQYHAGGFKTGGRMPVASADGDWILPTGKGRTLYVGMRENGKLLRVYEKGKQIGDKDSPWVRWEVEMHNIDRVIPWDVLLAPGRYVAGSYPALSWVQADTSRIKTLRKTDGITYERLVRHARQSVGKLVHTMVKREGSAEAAVMLISREGIPKRLELTERLGLRGDKPK